MNRQQSQTYAGQCCFMLRQACGVCYKNYRNHMASKRKLLGEMVLPLVVCLLYGLVEYLKQQNPIIGLILGMLLKMYVGLVGVSAMRELVNLFMTEKTQNFRQYQMIFGLSHRVHTLSNLFYMGCYLSFFILPFYLTLNYYHFDLEYVFYFGAYVISSCSLAMMTTAFFKDLIIAQEVTNLLFMLGAFLPFIYQPLTDEHPEHSWSEYLAMIMPNSAFALSVLNRDIKPALVSLFCVKIYFIVYSLAEFPQYYVQLIAKCCSKLRMSQSSSQSTQLTEEFELNEVMGARSENQSRPQSVIISAHNLEKSYTVNKTKVNALNGVNINISRGEIFGLLGRNGAGKTTLVDILTGVTTPTQGEFSVNNGKEGIGICYQHEVLYEQLTVEEHLVFYSMVKPMTQYEWQNRQEEREQIIQMLGIDGERDKKSKELSGGNKRKLSIAISIIAKPQVLIFDEPTSGLDPLSRMNVWQILKKLRSSNSAIILTTHHLDEAQRLADRVSVIEKGSLIVESTAQAIKYRYGKGYYLSIAHKDVQLTGQHADKFRKIADKLKLKTIELDHLCGQIGLLVKPGKEMQGDLFEEAFMKLIRALEADSMRVSFRSNSLEESFIAILKDSQNSGDSLESQMLTGRPDHAQQPYGWCVRGCWQTWGNFIKSIYYHKSCLLQSILIYNINIFIILVSTLFNRFFTQFLQENVDPSAETPQAKNNPTILMQGYTIMASAFINSPVYEREKKIRKLMNARGLRAVPYWLGSFIFDFAAFSINLLIMAYFIAPEEVEKLGYWFLEKQGVAIILFAYCCSFLFNKVKTAQTWFSVINFLVGFIVIPLVLLGQNTFFGKLEFIKYFYPYLDLNVKVLFEMQDQGMSQMAEMTGGIKIPKGSTLQINILLYICLIICIELDAYHRLLNWSRQPSESHQAIKMENVSHNYGSIQALSDVSYSVSQERLALLGHNGAGKSTTFELLSCQLTASSGKVFVEGHQHMSHQNTMRSGGICYQDNTLWQNMQVSQIQTIVSYIVPIRQTQREFKWLFDSMEYDPNNTHKRFKQLSGGNKRKLCMMVALYGDPQLRLLDQCSTGLDPSSRLAMVETIKHSTRGTTVFTTHSMSEAEDLCTKAVIMSKGRVLEWDFISRLKSRHFNCWWLEVTLCEQPTYEKNESIVTSEIMRVGTQLISSENGLMKIQVERGSLPESEILQSLISLKKRGVLTTFSAVMPRLEDVYIKVTRQEREEGEQGQGLAQL